MTEKLGLAFSGGGFRASFYHIGVLAQLAEQGLLKSVEVISTVSGGSIIGALYYLHVKNLLESKSDAEITHQDYIAIVQQIETSFLAATQHNIRMETFASFKSNLKMSSASYSRSDRLAELYNDYLYQTVLSEKSKKNHPVQMQELKIYPNGDEDFIPSEGNPLRQAKVPILVLNATTLNTGRNWQFTSQNMGEPPDRQNYSGDSLKKADDTVDKKTIRLRRPPSYADVTPARNNEGDSLQNISLGHAVAASACVPGLFPPLSITGLYNDFLAEKGAQTITPQLVDGGVFDNQGVEGLLQNECNCFIISDAAGQMGVENEVSTGTIPVLLRVSSILQDRVRSESLKSLFTPENKGKIAFMDLRRGLGIREIAWVNRKGKQGLDKTRPAYSQNFKIDPRVQEKLSLMRTDLDAFTEVEAYSLMLDGYRMTENELPDLQFAQNYAQKTQANWKFTEIAPWAENPDQNADYLYQLEVAEMVAFKALRLFPIILIVLFLSLGLIGYFWHTQIMAFLLQPASIEFMLLAIVIWVLNTIGGSLAKAFKILNYLRPYMLFSKRVTQVLGLLLGTLFFKFYLHFINPLFLKRGSLDRLRKLQ